MTNHKSDIGRWGIITTIILVVIILAILILKKSSCERSGGFWMVGSQGSACIIQPEGMFNGKGSENEGV